MIKKCPGCGALLQSERPELEGYVEPEVYEKANICKRCFRIKCYGDYVYIKKDNEEYMKILKDIKQTNDLVIYIVDLFNLNDNVMDIFNFFDKPLILVLNKRDLLPKSVKDSKLINWIKQYNMKVLDIVVTSCKNNYNFDKLYKLIKKHKRSNNVYIVGNTNAGKSTLINTLIKLYSDKYPLITTSILPSTTLEQLEIKLNDDITLIDTPGLLDNSNIANHIDYMTLKKIIPKKEIKPRTYQIRENQSLLINGLVRIDYVDGRKNSFTLYIANDIKVNKINIDTNDNMTNLTKHHFDIMGGEDIVINGLCFIKIVSKCEVDVYVIDKVGVYKRKKLI